MGKRLSLEGCRFGRLLVLSYTGNEQWNVRCDCGTEKRMRTSSLKEAKSCGCIRKEKNKLNAVKNVKICTVCGKPFPCSPSSKKITCSKECSLKRKISAHTGIKQSDSMKLKVSEKAKERGTPESFNAMIEANANSPKCRRGEMHSAAKKWTVKCINTQETFSFTNLSEWIRNNPDRFDISNFSDADVYRIAHGFYKAKSNFLNGKGSITYKGWQIIAFDDRKNYEREYQ